MINYFLVLFNFYDLCVSPIDSIFTENYYIK